jgi:hypothetical protein
LGQASSTEPNLQTPTTPNFPNSASYNPPKQGFAFLNRAKLDNLQASLRSDSFFAEDAVNQGEAKNITLKEKRRKSSIEEEDKDQTQTPEFS